MPPQFALFALFEKSLGRHYMERAGGPDEAADTHTPHVPPNPTMIFPFSTMTGTWRPPERAIILSSSFLSALTSM
jgi:hypothetical protein